MSLSDLQKPAEEQPEPAQQATAEAKEAEPAAGAQSEQQPTGKPRDLKNRNKQQPAENQEPGEAEAAAGQLIPGKDFDPQTGEVWENGRPVDDRRTTGKQPEDGNGKIVALGQRAAQG